MVGKERTECSVNGGGGSVEMCNVILSTDYFAILFEGETGLSLVG